MPETVACTLADLGAHLPSGLLDTPGGLVLLASPSVRERTVAALPQARLTSLAELAADNTPPEWLLVVGGGSLIDAAKLWRRDRHAGTRLAAAASVWGSGAEVSPIAVGTGYPKRIATGEDLRPDLCVRWSTLAETLTDAQRRWACGDVWSHALEALLSPLASADLQDELGRLLHDLLAQPCWDDAQAWFALGERACSLQARASVGLVHGIAHVLEPRLRAEGDTDLAHHARLCATAMAPVLAWSLRQTPKAGERLARQGLDAGAVLDRVQALHEADSWARLQGPLRAHWDAIVRDPCSRTHVCLVRRDGLERLLAAETRP